ncbi:Fasciclin-2 like protein [Argiope bruennichi]|uniref:Fasciclin-2 like protein n=1 Tax=Argiope bruennichi TaxID=94029 RepID=A0A8T0G042_ARGBR|nr:Fasciclin-2 like protein [Argiope bruennichi]
MLFFPVLLVLTYLLAAESSGHLRLEPPGDFYAFFTGDSFFITCIPDPSSRATRLTWQTPNGRDITHTRGRVHVEPSANNILGLELVVEDVRYKDQGTFTCSAVVDGRETRIQFHLKVYLSITFWDTPDVQIGKEGTDFMIMCNVRADPSPIVSWYVNDTIIMDGPRRTITEDGLFVRNLKTSDSGTYTCRAFVVTPHKSQIQDKNIAVYVHYKPVWVNPDIDTFYAVVGSTGSLVCEARSEPSPTFEWFKGRALLGNSKIYKIINEKYRSTLQGVPPNVPSFTLTSEEAGILAVKIYQSPHDTLPLTGYKIQWKPATASWKHAREYLTSTGNDVMIQDLNFDSDYAVRVSARNEIGYSNFTETLIQRTKGLIAETVVDGSKVLSSTFNNRSAHLQNSLVLYGAILFMIDWSFQRTRAVS